MNDREKWRERVRDIRAGGRTWWWGWYIILCWVGKSKFYLWISRCFFNRFIALLSHALLWLLKSHSRKNGVSSSSIRMWRSFSLMGSCERIYIEHNNSFIKSWCNRNYLKVCGYINLAAWNSLSNKVWNSFRGFSTRFIYIYIYIIEYLEKFSFISSSCFKKVFCRLTIY